MSKAEPNFKRKDSHKYSKLGKGRKSKQVWRNPTGRHNKMRNKRAGHPAVPSIGYGTDKKVRGTIQEKTPVYVYSIKELEQITNEQIAIIGNVGKLKKIALAEKAKEKKIAIYNLNPKKYLEGKKKKEVKGKITLKEAKKIIEEHKETKK